MRAFVLSCWFLLRVRGLDTFLMAHFLLEGDVMPAEVGGVDIDYLFFAARSKSRVFTLGTTVGVRVGLT